MIEAVKEAIEAENNKFKKLAVLLLDDEDGITEEAYTALLDVMPEESLALALNREVKAQDGRFYLPEDHGLQDWRD
jgi:DNA polymerase III delta prime subunit